MAELAATADIPRGDRAFLGHPIGLAYLAFTEAWERFSFYGMQALLVLYMVDRLLRPGHMEHVAGLGPVKAVLEWGGPLSGQALASAIFGVYAASVYLTPLAGGLIGDRWIGRRAAVTLGAVLMAAGHFLMAFEWAFVAALALLILGCGFLKGNIASQVGLLYGPDDPRRDDAFQIYVLAINAGVIAAPLVCGTLGELYGWHWGFTAAGVGMLLALCIYLAGGRYLPADSPRQRRAEAAGAPPKPPLTGRDWRTIAALVALIPILGLAFVGNNQIYNVYMIWARDNADLMLMGWRAPVTWLQSLDAFVSVGGLVVVALFWRVMAARRIIPSELTKLTIGCAIAVLGFVDLAVSAAIQARTGVKVPLVWLIAFHVINSIAYANLLPVALSQFSRSAPPAVNATMIGVFYLLFFMTNLMVGWIGGFYEKMTPVQFWLLHAGLCAAAAAVLVLLHRPLKIALAPVEAEA